MEKILEGLRAINFDSPVFWKSILILAAGTLLLGTLARFLFGKRSILNQSISSAIGILFIYAATIVLHSMGAQYRDLIAPLPFVSFSEEKMLLFSFVNADYTIICTQILSMIILAFLANLMDSFMPEGKSLFGWFIFRCFSVVLAMAAHLVVDWLFTTYLPEGLVTYAPTIMLGLLVLLLLVGALKFVVGAILATVNPLIAAFYTFFFATLVGKALTKAILTSGILCAVVWALGSVGCTAISIASAALIAYIPLLVILLIVWYVVSHVL